MNLIPLFGRILITPFEAYKSSRIAIPDSVREHRKSQMGTIVAVPEEEAALKAGDKVAFSWYKAEEIEHEGTKYALVKRERVLAKLTD